MPASGALIAVSTPRGNPRPFSLPTHWQIIGAVMMMSQPLAGTPGHFAAPSVITSYDKAKVSTPRGLARSFRRGEHRHAARQRAYFNPSRERQAISPVVLLL